MRRLIVLAVVALTVLSATPLAVKTVAAAATVDPTLCPGNSSRIAPFSFLFRSCADQDHVWIRNPLVVPLTFSSSGDLGAPVLTQSDDASVRAFRTLLGSPEMLFPGETLVFPAGPGEGSVTLHRLAQSLIFEWAFAKAIAPLVPEPSIQLVADGASVIQQATQCIAAGGTRTKCYLSAVGAYLSSILSDLQGLSSVIGKDLAAIRKYILKIFTGQFAFQSYLDAVQEEGRLNFLNDTLTILPRLQITTDGLPEGTVGVPYDQTLQATGGTSHFSWQLTSGTLPDALSLDPETGVISGTPTIAGTSTFDVTVSDTNGQADTATFVLAVTDGVTATPADAVANTPYSTRLPGIGSPPYTWQVTTGTLPDGLALDSTTGVISGTPPRSACFTSYVQCFTVTSAFTVQVTDSQGQTASLVEQIRVQPSPMCTADCSLQVAMGAFYSGGPPALIVTSPAQAPCGGVPVQCESILFVRDPDGSVHGVGQYGWIGPSWLHYLINGVIGPNYVTSSNCRPGQSEWADVATWDGVNGHPFQLVAVSNVVQC